jgi:hypothetical protein
MLEIVITHEPMLFGIIVSARLNEKNYFNSGKEVGYARFVENGNGTHSATTIFVYPEHRRQYIATRIYEYVESLGITITPAAVQSDLGKIFWDKRNDK